MTSSIKAVTSCKRTRRNIFVHIGIVITLTSLLLITGIPAADASGELADRLIIDLEAMQVNIPLNAQHKPIYSQHKLIYISFSNSFFRGSYLDTGWEVEQYTPVQYHIRHKSWKNFYWSVDTDQKKAWCIKGSDMRAAVSESKLLEDVIVKGINKNTFEMGSKQISISLTLTSPRLILEPKALKASVVAAEAIISSDNDWKVRQISANVCQFQFKQRQSSFWQIDMAAMTVHQVHDGTFGFLGGHSTRLSEVVHTDSPDNSPQKGEIPIDLGMAQYSKNQPRSVWQESEKALNDAVLRQSIYDVLVVPFQVSGHAIDRVDRSLMTRYLVQALEASTDLKLPSPTIVARTLGETSRTFDDFDVFQLANKLGVKRIIRGYVGHDLNERMTVTIVMQTRSEQEYFSPMTKTVTYSWKDIAISDERTPAEAFSGFLHDITARLQLPKGNSKTRIPNYSSEKAPALPPTVKGVVVSNTSSPIDRAYYLQLLGMLHPEQSIAKEQLFERSLVVLRDLPTKSGAYRVLKARALFYLYRRPAAVAALGSPISAEEKAFSAVLNGDLQLLKQSLNDINDPLHRIIAQIELSDLLWSYNPDDARNESVDSITQQYPAWEFLLKRRLQHQDGWNVQSNLAVKFELDSLFPIPGFTAQDIVKGKMAINETPADDEDIDFSVYHHYKRMMENQQNKMAVNESTILVDRDVLDLMVSLGESNLLKTMRLRSMQALYDEMIKLVDRYSTIYNGHPEMSYFRYLALYYIANTKQGQAQQNLRGEANQAASNACFWSQGQTEVSRKSCYGRNYYDGDYPRRWYWTFSKDPKDLTDRKYKGTQEFTQRGKLMITPFDRKEFMNYELSLLYTQTDFSKFSSYYKKLQFDQMPEEATALLQKNQHRFIGNPSRTVFFARLAEKESDFKRAKSIYDDAIAFQPNDWNAYEGLSSLLMRQGEFKAASETALQYPLFSVPLFSKDSSSLNTVALSNRAFDVGRNLWWRGATNEAKPLFKLSAGYETGSGAGMQSEIYLATLEHDFITAAQVSLQNAKRYNQTHAYVSYMEFLHIMGYHDAAWTVLKQIHDRSRGTMDWDPVLIGLRMEGKTTDEQLQWLKTQPVTAFTSQDTVTFAFLAYTFDRNPDKNLSDRLKTIREQSDSAKSQNQKPPAALSAKQPEPAAVPKSKVGMPESLKKMYAQMEASQADLLKKITDPVTTLADGYALLNKHKYTDAYEKLKVRFLSEWIKKDMFSFVSPYLAWSAVKSGKTPEVEAYFIEYKKEIGDDFDYYLSQAFLAAGKKNHQESMTDLERARYHVRYVNGERLFPAWYQLMETCEWLFEDTKFEGYRELLLKFAKLYQTIRPMDSWAYAFEAKYTRSDSDRVRALAITLYLDKQSERIAHFSEKEKTKAREWFKENNPFLQATQKGRKLEV